MIIQDKVTQKFFKATGRKIDPEQYDWLMGPIGNDDIIKDNYIQELAIKENLDVVRNEAHSGLISDLSLMGLSASDLERLQPQINDFYQHTSDYRMEFWADWNPLCKPFAYLLTQFYSRRLQQLNLPLDVMDSAKGLESEIVQLKNKETKKTIWTIWYRILKSRNDVIYSGVYSHCKNPYQARRQLKVIFPLPGGSATVVMDSEVLEDGSLKLSSDGKKFGDNGFYFILSTQKEKGRTFWANYIRAMHEWIHVYVDEDAVLRANHSLQLFGIRFLKLHYKMMPKNV